MQNQPVKQWHISRQKSSQQESIFCDSDPESEMLKKKHVKDEDQVMQNRQDKYSYMQVF